MSADVQAIVDRAGIVRSGSMWLVPSLSSEAVYRVTLAAEQLQCTCESFRRLQRPCKHIKAAAIIAAQQECEGCGETASVTSGEVQPRFMPGTVTTVRYCAECWYIVDHCDPRTGSFGAGCCDVRRADQSIGTPVVATSEAA